MPPSLEFSHFFNRISSFKIELSYYTNSKQRLDGVDGLRIEGKRYTHGLICSQGYTGSYKL